MAAALEGRPIRPILDTGVWFIHSPHTHQLEFSNNFPALRCGGRGGAGAADIVTDNVSSLTKCCGALLNTFLAPSPQRPPPLTRPDPLDLNY